MTDARLLPITNTINNSAWGMPGGVAAALGWPATDEIQAEYWLGAHPSAPSRTIDGTTDLATWENENSQHLPFLLKVLTAAKPLSLQAHPTTAQAQEGFARENAAGISLDAFERSYKDPHAKPELIVALTDGFQALCGFRDPQLTANELTELASQAENPEPILAFRDLLLTRGIREAVAFTLSRTSEVAELVTALVAAGADHPVISAVHESFAGDDGIAFALLLNHVTLAQGECLFLPAGNVHAYMYGSGIELMGPSDNVLRGGLTVKYVDEAELMKTLVFESADAPYLAPLAVAENVTTYRPSTLASGTDVPFELVQVTADATIELSEAAIGLVTDGAFTVQTATASLDAPRGSAFFITAATTLTVRGSGTLWVAKRAH